MKVHDETWRAEQDVIGAWDIVDASGGTRLARSPVRISFVSNDDPGYDAARARLAAAAPEMARLLLALHGQHGDKHLFDWSYWSDEIEKVLAKAGVPTDT